LLFWLQRELLSLDGHIQRLNGGCVHPPRAFADNPAQPGRALFFYGNLLNDSLTLGEYAQRAMNKPWAYLSYLVRLWRSDDASPWRASLEDARTHEHHTFSETDQLFAFLREQMQTTSFPEEEPDTTHRSQP
jgi:hypothetical protein